LRDFSSRASSLEKPHKAGARWQKILTSVVGKSLADRN